MYTLERLWAKERMLQLLTRREKNEGGRTGARAKVAEGGREGRPAGGKTEHLKTSIPANS